MNVRTWQNFINQANKKEELPLNADKTLQVKLVRSESFDLNHNIDFSNLDLISSLSEDIHDALFENGVYGINSVGLLNEEDHVTVVISAPLTLDHGLDESEIEDVVRTLLENKGHCISEEKGRMRQYGIYRFGCLIEYDIETGERARSLDDIVSDIRAIPTVTIVSIVVGNEKISEKRYVAGLRIKYIPSYPGNLAQPEEAKSYILRLIKRIKNVRNVSRVTLKTDRIE